MKRHKTLVSLGLAAVLIMVPATASAGVTITNFIHEVLARVHQVVETSTRPVPARAVEKDTHSSRAQSSHQPRVNSRSR